MVEEVTTGTTMLRWRCTTRWQGPASLAEPSALEQIQGWLHRGWKCKHTSYICARLPTALVSEPTDGLVVQRFACVYVLQGFFP